jgi:hypothetical protein
LYAFIINLSSQDEEDKDEGEEAESDENLDDEQEGA